MVDCFSRRKPESDLRCLEKAIEKGHVEAIYTYGIILISFGGELREQGLQIVSSLNLVNFRVLHKAKLGKQATASAIVAILVSGIVKQSYFVGCLGYI
ncbi:hypothetical protein V6N13_001042 [Hibiscus sabdariffa]